MHLTIISVNIASIKEFYDFSTGQLLSLTFKMILVTIGTAAVLYLIIEAPLKNIEKKFMISKKRVVNIN